MKENPEDFGCSHHSVELGRHQRLHGQVCTRREKEWVRWHFQTLGPYRFQMISPELDRLYIEIAQPKTGWAIGKAATSRQRSRSES